MRKETLELLIVTNKENQIVNISFQYRLFLQGNVATFLSLKIIFSKERKTVVFFAFEEGEGFLMNFLSLVLYKITILSSESSLV